MTVTIYHNPRCSKSRQTLDLLRDRGIDPDIIEYLQTPPDTETLRGLLDKLGMELPDVMRTNEEPYKAAKDKIQAMNACDQLDWLAANPLVLQRPIVINGDQARIGRPPEAVLEIL